jgi:hypothetical protein
VNTKPLLANLVCGSPSRNQDFDFARRAAQRAFCFSWKEKNFFPSPYGLIGT